MDFEYNSDEEEVILEIEDEVESEEEVQVVEDEDEEDIVVDRYEILQHKQVLKEQRAQLMHVVDTLQLPMSEQIMDTVYSMLKSYQWSNEKLLSDLFELGEEKVLERCGLGYTHIVDCENVQILHEHGECMSCMDDNELDLLVNSNCGHSFCANCWYSYLSIKLRDNVLDAFLSCMAYKCSCVVNHSFVYDLLVSFARNNQYEGYITLQTYKNKRIEGYVSSNPYMRWCSSVSFCGRAVKLHNLDDKYLTIECPCSNTFCFACGNEPHLPATCEMMKSWKERLDDESSTIEYLQVSSRPCPKCKIPVEKISGCDRMICYVCQYTFCWHCMKGLDKHSSCLLWTRGEFFSENALFKASSHKDMYYSYFAKYTTNREWIVEEHDRRNHSIALRNSIVDHSSISPEWIEETFTRVVSSRRLLVNCYVYAFYTFEMEQVALQIKTGKQRKRKEPIHDKTEKSLQIYKNLYLNLLDQLHDHLSEITRCFEDFSRTQDRDDQQSIFARLSDLLILMQKTTKGIKGVITDKDMHSFDIVHSNKKRTQHK